VAMSLNFSWGYGGESNEFKNRCATCLLLSSAIPS
jgi:hypothetical protein